MVSADQLAAFAAAAFVLIVIPGPSVLLAVGRALAYGHRIALATVAGNAVGLKVVAPAPRRHRTAVLEEFMVGVANPVPRRLELIGGIGGLAMIGLGLSIAATKSNN